MSLYNLFDAVKITETILLQNGETVPAGTTGAIVEVYNSGEAYEVELFGDWVQYDTQGNFTTSDRANPEAFVETIGVETLYPHQLQRLQPANQTVGVKARLTAILDELSEEHLIAVEDFAEFIRQKQRQSIVKD